MGQVMASKTKPVAPKSVSGDRSNQQGYYEVALSLLETESFLSLNKLALTLGCSYYTVRYWWQHRPEFVTAFKDARQRAVDEVKEHAYVRAQGLDGKNPSDLLTIYILNNFDEEIVARADKNREQEIHITIDVPSKPQTLEGWAQLVEDLPPADYRAIPEPAHQTTQTTEPQA